MQEQSAKRGVDQMNSFLLFFAGIMFILFLLIIIVWIGMSFVYWLQDHWQMTHCIECGKKHASTEDIVCAECMNKSKDVGYRGKK
jgi:hypothetical protein